MRIVVVVFHREALAKYKVLIRNKHSMLQQIEDARLHNAELIEDKFGRWVNVRKLESIMINQELEELKGIQHDFNIVSAQELFHWRVSTLYIWCRPRAFIVDGTSLFVIISNLLICRDNSNILKYNGIISLCKHISARQQIISYIRCDLQWDSIKFVSVYCVPGY